MFAAYLVAAATISVPMMVDFANPPRSQAGSKLHVSAVPRVGGRYPRSDGDQATVVSDVQVQGRAIVDGYHVIIPSGATALHELAYDGSRPFTAFTGQDFEEFQLNLRVSGKVRLSMPAFDGVIPPREPGGWGSSTQPVNWTSLGLMADWELIGPAGGTVSGRTLVANFNDGSSGWSLTPEGVRQRYWGNMNGSHEQHQVRVWQGDLDGAQNIEVFVHSGHSTYLAPEPSAVSMLVLGLLLCIIRRPRHAIRGTDSVVCGDSSAAIPARR